MLDNDVDKEKRWIEARQPKAAGLSTLHFHILSYVEIYSNVVAKDMGDDLGILRGTLSKQLALLKQRKMITSYQDSQDARNKHYVLTELGRQVAQTHDQLLEMKNNLLKNRLNQFSKAELKTIWAFLTIMNEAEENDSYSNTDGGDYFDNQR
ncbi:MarR family transcriptional regulator [Lentilactobacillus hilgardii]|nr:MarR family transcriptional regulator [Lentilactobacillus hilgardii]